MYKPENSDSDCNLAMLATESFDQILETIRTSSLNFHMQISPFSAVISIKKSLIKDQSGKHCLPSKPRKSSREDVDVESIVEKNQELDRKLAAANKKIEQMEIERMETLKTYDSNMLDVQHALKVANETSGKLSKALNDNRNKYEEEKAVAVDEHQAVIKALRKNLGEANKNVENLKKELNVLDVKDAEMLIA